MSTKDIYKQYLDKHGIQANFISEPADPQLNSIIVIPSFHEPDILKTLVSLLNTKPTKSKTEVLVILNHPEEANFEIIEFHRKQYHQIKQWILSNIHPSIKFYCTLPISFKGKAAGVGSARKAGMDEAIRRFKSINNTNGIIFNLDADCIVSYDYIQSIQNYFSKENHLPCVTINFSHQTDIPENIPGILEYELHLRYYILAQKYINYPFAFHTLGSCFAVKALNYCKQGGMNQRQAGEDFYFLHKFSVINQLFEFNEVLVYPSCRNSARVPFGTGKAISNFKNLGIQLTYSLDAILEFGRVIQQIKYWYKNISTKLNLSNSESLSIKYFLNEGLLTEINLCNNNCSSLQTFEKRMFRWFNPFRLMKFLHFARENGFPDQNIKSECIRLVSLLKDKNIFHDDLLELIRKLHLKVPN
ncbi:MAG: glycosyltransferase [Saprospiraceae bacterium]|nr:glycosyltransferase [Saprospiraceae bacterium]